MEEQPLVLVIEVVPFNFDEDEIPDRGNNFGRHADLVNDFDNLSSIMGDDIEEIDDIDENDESVSDNQSVISYSSVDDLFFGDLDLDEQK
jgi:hypothetical protein